MVTLNEPRAALVFFATAWGPSHGGINSLNHDLFVALRNGSVSGVNNLTVVTLDEGDPVPPSVSESQDVIFRTRADDTTAISNWLTARGSPPQIWWIGHDTHTGPHAQAAMQRFSRGKMALFIHSDPYSYEAYKGGGGGEPTIIKRKTLASLAKASSVVFGIGPKLTEVAKEILQQAHVDRAPICIIPGLHHIDQSPSPSQFRVFFSGRIDDRTSPLKQVHLAVDAFADCVKQRFLGKDPTLFLFGVSDASAVELSARAESRAGRQANLLPVPFSTDREQLFEVLRTSSVALMPSVHEGFGLAAWEAIAAGVPLILTKNSGVYQLLDSLGGRARGCVQGIDIGGSSENASASDTEALINALRNVSSLTSKRDATDLRGLLSKEGFTWESAATNVCLALGFPYARDGHRAKEANRQNMEVASDTSADVGSIQILAEDAGQAVAIEVLTPDWSTVALAAVESKDWSHAAHAFESSGLLEDARLCFQRAVTASPNKRDATQALVAFEARLAGLDTRAMLDSVGSGSLIDANAKIAAAIDATTGGDVSFSALQGLEVSEVVAQILGSDLCRALAVRRPSPLLDPLRAWGVLPSLYSKRMDATYATMVSSVTEIWLMPRRRSKVEAHDDKTRAVADLLTSIWLKRFGAESASNAKYLTATKTLLFSDPVFRCLIREASRERSRVNWWTTNSSEDESRFLEPFDRYKFHRLLDVSHTLGADFLGEATQIFFASAGRTTLDPTIPLIRTAKSRFLTEAMSGNWSSGSQQLLQELASLLGSTSSHRAITKVRLAVERSLLLLGNREPLVFWLHLIERLQTEQGGLDIRSGPLKLLQPFSEHTPTSASSTALLCGPTSCLHWTRDARDIFRKELMKIVPGITDSFNTNSHFALSLLGVFDSLLSSWGAEWVHTIVEARDSIRDEPLIVHFT
jgi:glycosyltransferase involved in cell wall biosynthesis